MNDLISIIVPIYNVELYLDRCIESLVKQTYSNLEIILVNDGSTDGCKKLCDSWGDKDSRIKVVHKQNGGVSSARNKGLELATGDYIGFVDPDDYISVHMYEILYESLKSTKADIAVCKNEEVDCNRKKSIYEIKKKDNYCVVNQKQIFELLKKEEITNHVTNHLYRRNAILYRFEPVKVHEDAVFVLQNFCTVETFVLCNEKLYFYYKREDSLVGYGHFIDMDVIKADSISVKYCAANAMDLLQWKLRISSAHLIQAYYVHKEQEQTVIREELKNQFRRYFRSYRCADIVKIMLFLILGINPYIFVKKV